MKAFVDMETHFPQFVRMIHFVNELKCLLYRNMQGPQYGTAKSDS